MARRRCSDIGGECGFPLPGATGDNDEIRLLQSAHVGVKVGQSGCQSR
jgi:hypothetical protein